jgi:pyruvate dehydrogenase E1 component alpha subunit
MRLGPLADPQLFNEPLDLGNGATDALLGYYRSMLKIRLAEEVVADLYVAGEVRCPCHLGIGQEAVAVGVSSALRPTDRVYGGHRSHSHYLAVGGNPAAMIAEIFGKGTGASAGMGGSMHLYAPEVGFHGSVPIVGATIPIAAGAALAAKMDGRGDVAVAYFGDGACEEGILHETLNMASVMRLPVLFVAENNLYSSHLDIKLRQPLDSVARFARANGVEAELVDGNDVVEVARAAERLVRASREGRGPGFIEAVTFRWRGHVGPNEDIDVGVRRSPDELAAWKGRDPIGRLRSALINAKRVAPDSFTLIEEEIRTELRDAVEAARAAPYPPEAALLDMVYANGGQTS